MSTSAPARPPRRWEIHTWVLLGLIALSAVLGLVGTVLAVLVAGSPMSALAAAMEAHRDAIDYAYAAALIGYLAAFLWWRGETRKLISGYDDALRHWALTGWRLALVASVALRLVAAGMPPAEVTPPDRYVLPSGYTPAWARAMEQTWAAGLVVRVLALLFLAIAVRAIRDRVRQIIAAPPRVWDEPPVASPAVAAPLPVVAADDKFWSSVQRLQATADGDLAVLEAPPRAGRRWSLLPAGGSVSPLRAAMAPGTVVTVFPEPVRAGASAPQRAPAGDEFFGLLEHAGALSFQLLLPTRVPAWLTEARSAASYGLYRTDDPDALTATMSQPSEASQPA